MGIAEKRKRSGPPAFPHLHPTQAKKAKQAWIDKVKLKSKWKAEKRKNGLNNGDLKPLETTEDEIHVETTTSPSQQQQKSTVKSDSRQSRLSSQKDRAKEIDIQREKDAQLKELTRRAYSRESLHTYKSDPLNKGRKGKAGGVRGKGQPNMKLRMNVLLEKIKRDVGAE